MKKSTKSSYVKNLVALPGMDGTGRLLHGFAKAVGDRMETTVLSYPTESFSYDFLTDYVASRLKSIEGDYVLLAESFSGPISARLAQEQVPGLRGLVLVVTFFEPPDSLLLPLTKHLPLETLMSQPIPCWISCQIMMNGSAAEEARETFCDVIREVSARAVSLRFREIRNLSRSRRPVDVPALYLQATEDRILPPSALDDVREIVPNLSVVRLPGPHLLLSVSPEICADHVVRFARTL